MNTHPSIAAASDWPVESAMNTTEVPDWVRETITAAKQDARRQPWKATFGDTVDCRMDDGEDLVTIEKCIGDVVDPRFPFNTQGSSLAA